VVLLLSSEAEHSTIVHRGKCFVQRVSYDELMQSVHESLDRSHIELLVALLHHRHLARAADALHLSASAASHRLKEAERRLGITLTTVHGRSIQLTPAAIHLAEVGEASQHAIRSAEATARWMTTTARPAVRIAFDFYDTAPWFERLIERTDLPGDVDFVRVGIDDVSNAVEQRRADLGVIAAPPDREARHGSELDVLFSDELVALVRNDHPAADRRELVPDDITDSWYLTFGDRPSLGFEHHHFFAPAGVRPRRLRKVESLAMILRLIRSCGGITVQPSLALRAAPLHDLCIVPLHSVSIPIDWQFATRPNPSNEVTQIIEAIRATVVI